MQVGFISFHDFVMGMGSLHRGNKKTKRSMAFGALDCENNGYCVYYLLAFMSDVR